MASALTSTRDPSSPVTLIIFMAATSLDGTAAYYTPRRPRDAEPPGICALGPEAIPSIPVAVAGEFAEEFGKIAFDDRNIEAAQNGIFRFAVEQEAEGRVHAFFRRRAAAAQALERRCRQRHLIVRFAAPIANDHFELPGLVFSRAAHRNQGFSGAAGRLAHHAVPACSTTATSSRGAG